MAKACELVAFAKEPCAGEELLFRVVEREVLSRVLNLGCVALTLMLTRCEERMRSSMPTRRVIAGREYQRRSAKPRTLSTRLGPVRYWRTYMLGVGSKDDHGFYPLDAELGLSAERVSFSVLSSVVRLATKLSFAEAKTTAEQFLPSVPSTEVIEQATLGLGSLTQKWFELAPAPEDDGDVLVILVDSKGAPTATEQELRRRRGPRKSKPRASSPRHRGRKKRGRYESPPRRKKGDKSKNARMATLVVMYTLRSKGTELLGPLNKWVYASFAPKKHAFAIALREAHKRGFSEQSGLPIQIVTDGDEDLELYVHHFFPHATHTLDVMHVVERLWSAGECLYREGSEGLRQWVEKQKKLLYDGRIRELVSGLRRRWRNLSRHKRHDRRRKRLKKNIDYLAKRVRLMDYAEWIDADLEIGSGAVEGAVKYVIGKRCDQGGMRWIRERAEAVVQLRCIEVNGDWERFSRWAHDTLRQRAIDRGVRVRIQQKEPAPLPNFMEAA